MHFLPETRDASEKMPSQAIRRFVYEPTSQELYVTFVSGATYAYSGVPSAIHDEFRAAPSKGRFFMEHIRDRFPYRRVGRDHPSDRLAG